MSETPEEIDREFADHTISQHKRNIFPDEWGDECPACGDPFDAGSTGLIVADKFRSLDTVAWVRICIGPPPEEWNCPGEEIAAMNYVHKDEHVDDPEPRYSRDQ